MSVADEILRLQQAKSDLATSITNKGVTVPAAATLDDYAALVDQIQQGGGTLPYDAEIEWLRSTGNGQYIDTGIVYDSTVHIAGSIKLEGDTSGYHIFGLYTKVGGSARRWTVNVGGTTTISPHFGTITNVTANFSRGTFHTVTANYRYLTVDGVPTDTKAAVFTPEHDVKIYLFARSNENTADSFRDCHISWFKIYKNSTLVRDYIPVRNGQVGYLYDKVTKTLFGNDGTDSFTLGPDRT